MITPAGIPSIPDDAMRFERTYPETSMEPVRFQIVFDAGRHRWVFQKDGSFVSHTKYDFDRPIV